MKKIISLSLVIAGLMITVASCKKSSAAAATGSSALTAGKSSISFTNTGSFSGGTTFSVSNISTTQATSSTGGSYRNIVLTATEISGSNSRTAGLIISVPVNASTASGNLTGDFSNPGNATIIAALSLSSTTGATNGISYNSQSGTCVITKLTASEIEGTFSGVVKDVNGSGTLTCSSGNFSAKFN